MFVLHALSQETDPPGTKLNIASIAFCCLQLRDATYFSRVDITLAELGLCKKACLYLFNANALLLKSVTPTLWLLGILYQDTWKYYFIDTAWGWVSIACKAEKQNT
jgi:hypothetical protein